MSRILTIIVLLSAVGFCHAASPSGSYDSACLWWDMAYTAPATGHLTTKPRPSLPAKVIKLLEGKGYVHSTTPRKTAPTTGVLADYYPSGDFQVIRVDIEGSGSIMVFVDNHPIKKGMNAFAVSRDFRTLLKKLDRRLLKEKKDFVLERANTSQIWFIAAVRQRPFLSIGEAKAMRALLEKLPAAGDRTR